MEAVGFWSAVCHLVTGPLTSPRFGALYLVLSLVVLVLPGFRLTRLGFELTETDLRIFQFFRTRTVGRDRVGGFGTPSIEETSGLPYPSCRVKFDSCLWERA